MAFKATINIDGKTLNVLNLHYGFRQNIDRTGRPSSNVRGGTVSLSIESSEDNTMLQWMIDPHGFKDCKITFYKRDQDSKMKEIELKETTCIDYNENFDANSSSPMSISVTLSCKEISVNGDSHVNDWPV